MSGKRKLRQEIKVLQMEIARLNKNVQGIMSGEFGRSVAAARTAREHKRIIPLLLNHLGLELGYVGGHWALRQKGGDAQVLAGPEA